jgi:hypothetical protein
VTRPAPATLHPLEIRVQKKGRLASYAYRPFPW